MRMTKTKDGKFLCNRHHGKGETRFFVNVPDDTKCSICDSDEIIMDYGIVAYRGWNLKKSYSGFPICLTSLVANYIWIPRVRQEMKGNLGFHSVKLLQPIKKPIVPDLSQFNLIDTKIDTTDTQITIKMEIDIPASILNTGIRFYCPQVIGSVYLWGQFVEHEYGYRAQYCYPKYLWVIDENLHYFAEDVGNLYGVPCEIYDEGESE